MSKRSGIPGLSFSWKRAVGLSAFKGRISRQIGIPLSRAGRQRMVGRAMGCSIILAIPVLAILAAILLRFAMA